MKNLRILLTICFGTLPAWVVAMVGTVGIVLLLGALACLRWVVQ